MAHETYCTTCGTPTAALMAGALCAGCFFAQEAGKKEPFQHMADILKDKFSYNDFSWLNSTERTSENFQQSFASQFDDTPEIRALWDLRVC